MKKSSIKKTKKKKTLKKLKEELNFYLEKEKYDKALNTSKKITELYSKNTFGYLEYIKIKTKSYTKYVEEDELKDLKKMFEKLYEISTKKQKREYKTEFDEYVNDCKETYNLIKIKKDITGKSFLKKVYEYALSNINKKIKNVKSSYSYNVNIKSLYDLIKGLFFIACLIFNLFNTNKLLIITVPFGIFGIITIYGVIDANFFRKQKKRQKLEKLDAFLKEKELQAEECEKEIKKLDESISFMSEQKLNSVLKIPKTFNEQISSSINDDEEIIAKNLMSKLTSNKIEEFSLILEKNTNIMAKEFLNDVYKSKEKEREKIKENFKMKKIALFNIVILIILSTISIFSLVVIINNFYELNFLSFVIAFIIGVVSNLIYNIEKGRHTTLTDTFNDNLCICVFRTSLVYNLIYSWITNDLSFIYNFVEIPLIFLFIFIGFCMLIAMLKYQNLYKKLMK